MPVLDDEGLPLHYVVCGHGEPVLLIHGLGLRATSWTFQIPALERQFRLIIPDLPGSGRSPPPSDGYGIPEFARSLWRLLDHLGTSRVSIVGFSLGGAVALEMSLQRPEQVTRLALINSLASYRVDHWRKWLEAWIPITLVRLLGIQATAWLLAARMFPQPWQSVMRKLGTVMIGAASAQAAVATAQAALRWTACERLDRLRSRTMIIAGEHDYVPLAQKRELAALIGAAMVIVRGSRHGTPFDSTQATNASLLALLTDQVLARCNWLACDRPSDARAALVGTIAALRELGAPVGQDGNPLRMLTR
jgi:pimeloyl-ACP methyl ester carboxylesterase